MNRPVKMSQSRKWLEANGSVLRWRFKGPNIHNPFDSQVSTSALEEYVSDRSFLLEACAVHAAMDDSEILKVTDLLSLDFTTEHPNLVDLTKDELRDYLESSGTWDFIDGEFKKLQQACQEELENRERN